MHFPGRPPESRPSREIRQHPHVRTVVLGAVVTNFGVESTARDAWERGYEIVIAEDVTSSFSTELHDFSMQHILPRYRGHLILGRHFVQKR